ncbi:DUF4345 domain-containing protein [Methyloceanibacter sp.]|uniref:DUF4345 domain-containing protein n=1 Tax=Methyloceanibacter sp. TaxID=1965321 RepID=UPI00356A2EA9
MTQDPPASPPTSKLMRFYLLLAVFLIVPIALNYGLAPAETLPKSLDVTVEGTDLTHIFRGLMCLYLGAALFWGIAAFTPSWQRTAVIWVVFFAFSIAVGRVISLIVDGRPSALLLIYLGLEIAAGLLGLFILSVADRKSKR